MSIFNQTKMAKGRKASILVLTSFLVGSTAVMSAQEYDDFHHRNGCVYKPARITKEQHPITVELIKAGLEGSNHFQTLFSPSKLSCFNNLEDAKHLVNQNNLYPAQSLHTRIGSLSPDSTWLNGVNVSAGLKDVHFKPRNNNPTNQSFGQQEAIIGMDVEIVQDKPLNLRDVQKFESKKVGDKLVIYLNDRPSDVCLAHTLITQLLEGDPDIGSFKLAADKSTLRFKKRLEDGTYSAAPGPEVVTQELNERLQKFKDQIAIEESIQKTKSTRVTGEENTNLKPSTASASTPKVGQEDSNFGGPSNVPYYFEKKFVGNSSAIKADRSKLVGNDNTYWGSDNCLTGNNNTVFGNNYTGQGNNNTFYGENNNISGNENMYYPRQDQNATNNSHFSKPTSSLPKTQHEPLNFGNQITNIQNAHGVIHHGITETLIVDHSDGRPVNFGGNVTNIQNCNGVTSSSLAKTIYVTTRDGANTNFGGNVTTIIGGNGGTHYGVAEDINITTGGGGTHNFGENIVTVIGGGNGTYCGTMVGNITINRPSTK